MKIYIVYNKDFTYYYLITNDISKYINNECFVEEVDYDSFLNDIGFLCHSGDLYNKVIS